MIFLKCSSLGFLRGWDVVKVSRTSWGVPGISSSSSLESDIFFPEETFFEFFWEKSGEKGVVFLEKDNSLENCLFSRFDFCADFSVVGVI